MNEPEALAAVLLDLLLHDITHEYDKHVIVWQAMDALHLDDTDANFDRLYDLLTSGKWRVVYVEATP